MRRYNFNEIQTRATFVGNVSLAYEKNPKESVGDSVLRCSEDIVRYARDLYGDNVDLKEYLYLIMIGNSGKVLGYSKLTEGGTQFAGADIKHMCITACLANAVNVALVHNHPCSSARPSRPDRDLTAKAREAFALFDIKLIDHCILTTDSYFSFRDASEL